MPFPRSRVVLVAAGGIAVSLWGAAVRADGAFPDSMQILLPADRPGEIVLSTNFGLVFSEDSGTTWTWTCEAPSSAGAYLYSMSAPPADRIFAVAPEGLSHSDDGGCTWTLSTGLSAGSIVVDAFPDPTNAQRIWTIVSAPGSTTVPDQVFLSQDGGDTLGASVYQTEIGAQLTGIESARTDPKMVFAALFVPIAAADYPVLHPKLARSSDGGQTWTTLDVEAGLGPNQFRIISIDPTDSQTLYLRVFDALADAMAVTNDGGMTFRMPLTLDVGGTVTAFARLASGTVLVGGLVSSNAVGFRSTDGATTFTDWPSVPFLRALGERGDRLYAATDNLYQTDWAFGASADEGTTFQPVMAYPQVKGVRACAAPACLSTCQSEAAASVWPPSVCSVEVDGGGAVDAGETVDAVWSDGSAAASDGGDGNATKNGCGCAAGGAAGTGGPTAGACFTLVIGVLLRRRGRRR